MSKSNAFLEEGLKLIECRQCMERIWSKMSTGRIETEIGIDTVEIAEGSFNSQLRQVDTKGGVVHDLDSLYDSAEVALGIFFQELQLLVELSDLPKSCLHVAPLKGRERALQKAKDDYNDREPGPGIAWLFDIVRGMVICEAEAEICKLLETLKTSSFDIIRLKNRFKNPTPGMTYWLYSFFISS